MTPIGECLNHHAVIYSLDIINNVFIDISPKWGLFGIINQIYHASGGNMMKCLPSGGWFSLGLRPRENHPPSGRHSIMLPSLAWHICIMLPPLGCHICCIIPNKPNNGKISMNTTQDIKPLLVADAGRDRLMFWMRSRSQMTDD